MEKRNSKNYPLDKSTIEEVTLSDIKNKSYYLFLKFQF